MSYANNPTSILGGTGITVTPTSGTGANTITVSAVGSEAIAVRTAITTPVTVLVTDEVVSIAVPIAAPVTVILPIGVLGQEFNIKDALGHASPATPITISPVAGTIDGAATAVINTPYGSLTLVFDGTNWLII